MLRTRESVESVGLYSDCKQALWLCVFAVVRLILEARRSLSAGIVGVQADCFTGIKLFGEVFALAALGTPLLPIFFPSGNSRKKTRNKKKNDESVC